jgi:hypothetical protein
MPNNGQTRARVVLVLEICCVVRDNIVLLLFVLTAVINGEIFGTPVT